MPLVTLSQASIAFGDNLLLDKANLTLSAGEKLGLIGRNGEGKSTLLKILGSQSVADDGEIRFQPGIRVAMLEQNPTSHEDFSVFEYVADGLATVGAALSEYRSLSTTHQPTAAQIKRLGDIQQTLDSADGWNLQSLVDKTLSRLRLDGTVQLKTLSGGWQRRAALARALVCSPDILLLDEPTNHLDVETIEWLEKQIIKFDGAIVLVTHDREFLQRVASSIAELDRGKLVVWPGHYENYLQRKTAALEQEERQNAVFDKKLDNEEKWIRQGIKARRTRNEGRVRALKKMRTAQSERRNVKGNVRLRVEQGQQSGKRVIEANNTHFAIDGNIIIKQFSTNIIRGDRIGLIGANGIGKTTLLRILLAEQTPTTGEIQHGTRLEIAYFDQLRSSLEPDKTVIDIIGQGREEITVNGKSRHVISYLSDFLFSPQRSRSPIRSLSGGERARVLLAQLFSKPANLLVMDEPTNDLDIETLELLEELLLQFDGTLLLVSHDRRFLDNVITSTISFEGNGVINEYAGGYSDWQRQVRQMIQTKPNRRKETADLVPQKDSKPAVQKNKLSDNQQRELTQLPAKIELLENQQTRLAGQMSDSGFYSQSAEIVKQVTTDLKQLSEDLEECYSRWDELESNG